MSDAEKNKRRRAVRIADAINATEGVPIYNVLTSIYYFCEKDPTTA